MSAPQHSRRRRLLRLCLILAFLAVLAELGGYAILWGLVGHRPRAGDFALTQAELVETGGRAAAGLRQSDLVGPPRVRKEVLHPYLGFMPLPPKKPRLDDGAWINEDGFYEPDAPIFDESEALVVGILGGSVAGQFLQMGRKALARELRGHPRFAGRELRFVGMAFGGYKEPQQLMALCYVLAMGGQLDILINIDGFNELALHGPSNSRQGVAPIFPRDWYFRAVQDDLMTEDLTALQELRHKRAARARTALHSPLGATWTGRAVWFVSDRLLARAARELQRELRGVDRELGVQRGGPQLEEEALDDQVRVWREASIQLQLLSAANGIEYFHALQPNQYVEGSKVLTEEERTMAYDPDHEYVPDVVRGYPLLLEAARDLEAAGVRFLDLTRLFEDVDETLYVDDCCHFNRLGNELVARALGQFILSFME